MQLFAGTLAAPLLDGDAGTEQTIECIRALIDDGLRDPVVNRAAIEILQAVPAFNDPGEVAAIAAWVKQNIRFTKDPVGKETLRPPRVILEVRAGDCDDFVVLLASLLGSVGYETRLVTIAADPAAPDAFSHIYLETLIAGQWVPVDMARQTGAYGQAPQRFFRKRTWNLTDSDYQDEAPHIGLAGYTETLGADAAVYIPQVTGGIADIIRATKGLPSDPWAVYRTPYTPYSQPAGYATVQAGGNPWLWIGGGLLLLWAVSR